MEELGSIFEEDVIIDNLVTDKEAYYEGRVVGDGICVVMGIAEVMAGAVMTVGGIGGGLVLAPASGGISIAAGASVAAEGIALGALGVGAIYSAANDMDDSKAKMADAHDEFNNIKKNELKGVEGADASKALDGVSSLSVSQKARLKTLYNTIDDHLTDEDFAGTLLDLQGKPIPKPNGEGYWDHLGEMKTSYKTLKRVKKGLEGSLKNPNLLPNDKKILEKGLEDTNYYINKIEDLFEPYGGIS